LKAYVVWLLEEFDQSPIDYDFLESLDSGLATLPDQAIQEDGRVIVKRMIESLKMKTEIRGFRPLVVVTSRELVLPGVESLYGYADQDSGVCLVSTARIANEPERLAIRLESVIRHELGHLKGLSHCYHRGCLMNPVTSPEQLDERDSDPCASCLKKKKEMAVPYQRMLAGLLLIFIFAGLNLAATVLDPAPKAPFDVVLEGDGTAVVALSFKGKRFWSSKSCEVVSGLDEKLNQLFREIETEPVTVSSQSNEGVKLLSGGEVLLTLKSNGAVESVNSLAKQLNVFFEAKGSKSSACAACHLDRKSEVLEAAYGRKWVWDRWKEYCL
jgi:predicted Zn-dependent protease